MTAIARLSLRDRRTLAFGVAAVFGLLGTARLIPRGMQWQARTVADADAARVEIDRLRGVSVRARLHHERQPSVDLARGYVAESTAFASDRVIVAGPQLIGILRDVAAESGVALRSVRSRADSAGAKPIFIVSAQMTASGDVRGLTELIRSIETHHPAMRIAALTVSQSDVAASQQKADVLAIDMTIQSVFLIRPANSNAQKR